MNDVIMIFAFAPIVGLLLGISAIIVPWDTLFLSVLLYDDKMFSQVKEESGVYSGKTAAARADSIAHATRRAITERMDEDPAFYEKFSRLIHRRSTILWPSGYPIELCHLIHHDHGKGFFRALERAMPDWTSRKHKLELMLV